jgi:hypothetical protein
MKAKSGLVYNIIVNVNGNDCNDYESTKLYRKFKELHLGRSGMKSKIFKDDFGNRMYSRRVWTGLYA